ncbi:alpha/beta hydrolase family protein [Clostridium tagluense]|uniref:alpha/beta hydrolase family protein n=1 Tax=Clostridium tagluense TaxID=360422 RepID=UPI001C6E0E41|nr:dienelactone hydrolase family protein [Clostridium tagluense]MBW9158697.1 dienelactone hydrolase family protein [Clostridium tagluense]WLC68165.1 dienelactone hydrolase family protein [Clostridium tagluense]
MKTGRIVKVLEDKRRKETLIECDENRKIIISFYYPIDETWKESRQALYADLYSPREDEFINRFKEMVPLENDAEKEKFLGSIKTNIYNDAPISKKQVTYPVIIHSTGLGSPRDYVTFNIEELVNKGYVVFTIGHIYDSMFTIFPNGQILEPSKEEYTQEEKENLIDIRKNDILFVLNQLEKLNNEDDVIKNKLDLQRIGTIGHSLGGAAVFKASQCDSRIKATVLFDASMQFLNLSEDINEKQRLNTPILNFRRGNFNYEASMTMFIDYLKDKFDDEHFKKQIILYDNILRDSNREQKALFNYLCGYKSFIKLNGTKHMTFTDYSIIKGEKMENETLSVEKSHEVINNITIRFLDEFLCGKEKQYSGFIKNNNYITLIDEDGQPIGVANL